MNILVLALWSTQGIFVNSQVAPYKYIQSDLITGIQMVLDQFGNFYIFSGKKNTNDYVSNIQIIFQNQTTESFMIKKSFSTTYPNSRSLYGIFYNSKENAIIIFGGLGPNGIFNDM